MKVYILKIPKHINVFYCSFKKILIFLKITSQKISVKLTTKLIIVKKNLILLSNILVDSTFKICISKFWFYNFNYLKLLFKFFFKQNLIKIKLNLIGVGFKFFVFFLYKTFVIKVKAGFSHHIVYKLPKTVKVLYIKPTLITIVGNCYQTVFNVVTVIKSLRLPDPYKKKGILYDNENIQTKQGKLC